MGDGQEFLDVDSRRLMVDKGLDSRSKGSEKGQCAEAASLLKNSGGDQSMGEDWGDDDLDLEDCDYDDVKVPEMPIVPNLKFSKQERKELWKLWVSKNSLVLVMATIW